MARRPYQVFRLLNVHYDRARDLIANHGLRRQIRTLDALQLSVAIQLHQVAPIDQFVCTDQRLCAHRARSRAFSATVQLPDRGP